MISLPIVAIDEIASPAELFRCSFYKTTLSAGICIARQGVRRKFRGGTAQGKKYEKEFVPKIYEYCASGKCMQGSDVRVALADYEPPATEAERMKERNRALGTTNLRGIEERIAAKVASGEFRPPDPLPPAIAEDIAEDLARAAQQAERDQAAAAVEEARPAIAERSEKARRSWDEFRERKEKLRAAAPAPAKPTPEPHPLSRRGLTESKEEGDVPEEVEQRICAKCKVNKLRRDNKGDTCSACQRPWDTRLSRGKDGAPPRRKILGRRARAAQRAAVQPAQAKVYPGLLQAQPADLEQLLEQRRAHHLAEAERCDRALKALRG